MFAIKFKNINGNKICFSYQTSGIKLYFVKCCNQEKKTQYNVSGMGGNRSLVRQNLRNIAHDHLGPAGHRWAPCLPHEPCYQGYGCTVWYSIFGTGSVRLCAFRYDKAWCCLSGTMMHKAAMILFPKDESLQYLRKVRVAYYTKTQCTYIYNCSFEVQKHDLPRVSAKIHPHLRNTKQSRQWLVPDTGSRKKAFSWS